MKLRIKIKRQKKKEKEKRKRSREKMKSISLVFNFLNISAVEILLLSYEIKRKEESFKEKAYV